jgi:hypothetical protein
MRFKKRRGDIEPRSVIQGSGEEGPEVAGSCLPAGFAAMPPGTAQTFTQITSMGYQNTHVWDMLTGLL